MASCKVSLSMKSSDIHGVLDEFEVRPSKSLGQNFLIDENVARWIVEQLEITSDDCVVEVGPGTGALTEHIVPLCRKLVLVEFDNRLADYQRQRWSDHPQVEVHHADGATWDPRWLFAEAPVKFMGNLPYSAGGAILQNFLGKPSPICRAVVMLQKEFIDRIMATPDDDAFGLLSLRMQMNWIPKALKTVPPEAFHPRPRIDSTVMSLSPRPADDFPPYNQRLMDELMRRAFSQRRKQIKKQLPTLPPWNEVCEHLHINEKARAEELSLAKWIDLTNCYDLKHQHQMAQGCDEIFDVVDAQDSVLSQKPRKQVHDEGLIHRAAHILLSNKKGDLLLQKRSHLKDRLPNLWDSSAAGHVDSGEDYASAALRELEEELGVSGIELLEIGSLLPSASTGNEHIHIYLGKYSGKISFPPQEVDSVLWLPPTIIDLWLERRPQDFASAFPLCWNILKTKQQ